ncbi:unnamed protein product [Arabidopsis thaliana]|uniref:(thale cress) hypothetical protein n=1 Tax=Arabidopsis thaliana TaxID=3702 RepID=A0A7G2E0Q4_ARATH|nr:unnamed protein product [Arabidopsis thaliana]
MEELDIHVALNIVSRASYDCITDVSELINLHSPYPPFFTRCLHAHNSTASYLESLKLAVREGHAETALQLLLTITNGPPHVYFATALLQLVLGSYEEAIQTIDTFVESVGSFEVADEIGSQVFRQMMQIGTHKIRRVGEIGFRELGPLIASGPDFKTLVFDHIVLDDVDTNEYIFVSRLANKGSITRPFLLRCLDAGNETAHYVEGLRLAAQEGPSQRSIDLISVAAPITFMLTSL